MVEPTNTPIEFNSMQAVLIRLDRIIYGINDARGRRDHKQMLVFISDFFKEICPDMKQEDADNIWADIKKLKLRLPTIENERFFLTQLDELDIRLRRMAKRLGYLTRNQRDMSLAVVT